MKNRYSQSILWSIATIIGRGSFVMPHPSQIQEKLNDNRAIRDQRTNEQIEKQISQKLG